MAERGRRAGAAVLALAALVGAAPPGQVDLAIEGQRSARGNILVCLTSDPAHFPDCEGDPAGRRATIAATDTTMRFPSLPSGSYALALIHDENGNGKLDTTLGVPREGVGFSRNPRLMFGPPRFAAARFAVGTGAVAENVRLKYFL